MWDEVSCHVDWETFANYHTQCYPHTCTMHIIIIHGLACTLSVIVYFMSKRKSKSPLFIITKHVNHNNMKHLLYISVVCLGYLSAKADGCYPVKTSTTHTGIMQRLLPHNADSAKQEGVLIISNWISGHKRKQ